MFKYDNCQRLYDVSMQKLDWYILKKFLVTFIFCLLLFTVVAVAVDSSEKADNFVKSGFNTIGLIRNYFIGFVPWIWGLLFPLFVFIAVIFFTSRMANRSEIIAILASGISFNRFLRPYLAGGIILASILWLGSRNWIPRGNVIKGNFLTKYVDKSDPTKNMIYGNCYQCYYLRTDSNTFVGIREYDTVSKMARGFFMEKIKDNRVIYNLRAELIQWDTAIKNWKLVNATERIIDSMGEKLNRYSSFTIILALHPDELRKDNYLKDKLTTKELAALIKREKARGTEGLSVLQVEWHRRTATPVSVLLLTIIGVAISSRKKRGGSGFHLAMGIIIAAVFILSDRFSTVFATKGNFHPMLAAWLPNIVFSGVAYWLYRKAPQ